ncbi:MAG: TIGR04283 family arsenosugar biosynthesis glycosyltransferase [Rhodospirillales bacterium]|nr:TIGR04283 family arsenosugar biosynthesis glycosyltransferase [Alphaproteobacteria bacterium]MBL6948088.1 TIGR04283 family arsenosugar biosynthesis glycosyltransferase [Rhodospirillales bacterium]
MISIVIPTLNAEAELPGTLESLSMTAFSSEIIIADGGSTDATPAIAADAGAKFTATLGGRGAQMASGAMYATGDWLLFLHADTRPQPGWNHVVGEYMKNPSNRFRAAYFQLILNDTSPAARRVEGLAAWRCRVLGLPYGDQGLLISSEFYDFLGGMPPIPLMEDVDIVRRIGKKRLDQLPAAAVTSAARYRRDGYWLRPAKNLLCLGLYFAGVPPRMLAGLYE